MPWNILVVDDQPVVLNALEKILKIGPYEVFCALSATEGLAILEQAPVDLIISDERMPGMSGSEFLAIARQRWPRTVRVMLTGYASLATAMRAINEGEIFRFLTKPINSQDLHNVVKDAMAHMAMQNEICQTADMRNSLEKQAPGITQVKRDEDGCIIIDLDEEQ